MAIFGNLFGGGNNYEKKLAAALAARRAFWARYGETSDDVLAPLISEHLMSDAPAWPHAREGFALVRPPGSVVLVSDGLSNPPDPKEKGEPLGYEAFLEITDPSAQALALTDFGRRPEFNVLRQTVFNLIPAGRQRLLEMLAQYGAISMEIPVDDGQTHPFIGAGQQGPAWGVLIGVKGGDFPLEIPDLPTGSAPLISVTMIHGTELAHLAQGGANARRELVEALAQKGYAWRTDITRAAII